MVNHRYPFRFNGHPPLGVNATDTVNCADLGDVVRFNGHPPLGVNATQNTVSNRKPVSISGFNGHPPLGVNATRRSKLCT